MYKKSTAKTTLLASCALLILSGFCGNALAQNSDNQTASIPATNIAELAPRIVLNDADKVKLRAAINSANRIDTSRDKYRHPEQTLEFFGIKPDATVIEIWPGQGWYSAILGPYLKAGGGHLIAANFDTSTTNSDLVEKVVDSYKDKFAAHPEIYGDVKLVPFGPRSAALGADNSADAVVTFRNIHNWMAQGWSDKAFNDFYRVLKPGGILGIEEHRGDDETPQDPLAADGYVRQDYVISLAKDAGFELVEASEINANSKDTKDHPFGVWTLPPVLRTAPMGQAANPKFDSSRYNAIGESDRMTLLFRKPLKSDKPAITVAEKGAPFPIPVIFGDKKSKKDKTTKVASKIETAKQSATTTITQTTAKVDEVKTTATTAIESKTPSWDNKAAKTKTDTPIVAADIAAAKASASSVTKIPELPAAIVSNDTAKVTNDNAPIATPAVAAAAIATAVAVPFTEPKASEAKTEPKTEAKAEVKPETKPSKAVKTHKTPIKTAKTEEKKPESPKAAEKKAEPKEKATTKTSGKKAVKPTEKAEVAKSKAKAKTTVKKAEEKPEPKGKAKASAKTEKTASKAKPAAKAKASAPKNPNTPDWVAPKKRK